MTADVENVTNGGCYLMYKSMAIFQSANFLSVGKKLLKLLKLLQYSLE